MVLQQCITALSKIPGRLYPAPRQINTHCIILPLFHPLQEAPWTSKLTKNSKQKARKWKNKEADAAPARSNFVSGKKGASAYMASGAFPSRSTTNNGFAFLKPRHNFARSSTRTKPPES